MVNSISEKGLHVNHKVKILNFPGGTSEKILEKLDDQGKSRKITKENNQGKARRYHSSCWN